MENNSNLLRLLKTSSAEEFLRIMHDKNVATKTKGPLTIFNYGPGADFSDPYVCESRGIILDLERQTVVCRAFDKFFNYSEPYASEIDWKSAHVQEKVDGSIVKLYFYDGRWHWATNGVIDAEDANVNPGLPVKTYMDIIRMCDNYRDIPKSLDRDNTYIFELVSPYNRIVIPYTKAHLYHIGTRDNYTGEEYLCDIGMEKPCEYPLKTPDECIRASAKLNNDKYHVTKEGFVVVDKYFRRVKIKSPEYVCIHHSVNNHTLSKDHILKLIDNEDFNVDAFTEEFPEYKDLFEYYREELAAVKRLCEKAMANGRKKLARTGDRKAVWEAFRTTAWKRFAFAGMMAVGNDVPIKDLMRRINPSKLYALVRDISEKTL